jgi:hypothetical protein
LTAQVNGTSVGSVPLNRKESQVGQVVFNIPAKLIQDYNDLTLVAQQSNTPPDAANLVMPPFGRRYCPIQITVWIPAPTIPLNFSRYPYPFFDDLSLDTNRIVYLLPKLMSLG